MKSLLENKSFLILVAILLGALGLTHLFTTVGDYWMERTVDCTFIGNFVRLSILGIIIWAFIETVNKIEDL